MPIFPCILSIFEYIGKNLHAKDFYVWKKFVERRVLFFSLQQAADQNFCELFLILGHQSWPEFQAEYQDISLKSLNVGYRLCKEDLDWIQCDEDRVQHDNYDHCRQIEHANRGYYFSRRT